DPAAASGHRVAVARAGRQPVRGPEMLKCRHVPILSVSASMPPGPRLAVEHYGGRYRCAHQCIIREGQPATTARAILAGTTAHPQHEFWPDDLPYTEVPRPGNHRPPPGHRRLPGSAREGPRS